MEGACQKAAAVNEQKESLSTELRAKQKKCRDAEVRQGRMGGSLF